MTVNSGNDVTREVRWNSELAKIIDHIDSDDLPKLLIEGLAVLVPFSMSTVFVNRGRSRPICIYDTFPNSAAKSGIDNYISSSYVVNPFYLAHLNGIKEGLYRIRDLAPDGYFPNETYDDHKAIPAPDEEIGYTTVGWPKGFEEINIAVPIGDVTVEIALFNRIQDGGFDEDHMNILHARSQVICAILRKYWQLHSDKLLANPRDSSMDEVFESFGSELLSQRECEVIQYVMRGHSSESIALNLNISITTVKTHRKRAYAKLEISSQSELFSLFLKSAKVLHA
ncbi:MAG: helix-turn-helix transcriptional regulator [Rhodospirillales bacterium]|jgi:DNA-binding CsgD family transcriptional regulator|nr:helix-turn-helix transcriptional regulator [Rhodospirillales bacterium]